MDSIKNPKDDKLLGPKIMRDSANLNHFSLQKLTPAEYNIFIVTYLRWVPL